MRTSNALRTVAKLNDYMDALANRGYFNGAVLVAEGNKILLRKGYGMANFEHDVPNTPQTKFRIGSLTKGFTAMAVLQLQEQESFALMILSKFTYQIIRMATSLRSTIY